VRDPGPGRRFVYDRYLRHIERALLSNFGYKHERDVHEDLHCRHRRAVRHHQRRRDRMLRRRQLRPHDDDERHVPGAAAGRNVVQCKRGPVVLEPSELQRRPVCDFRSFELPLSTRLGTAALLFAALSGVGCSACSKAPKLQEAAEESEPKPEVIEPPVTPQQACANFGAAVCGRMQACTPFLLQVTYGDVKACARRTALQCEPMLSATGTQSPAAQVEVCAKAISSEGCDEALDNPQPSACDIGGVLAEGSPCAAGHQCQTTYCKITAGDVCGVCVKRVGPRYACLVDNDCVAGLICSGGACAAPGGVGAVCGVGLPACSHALTCISGTCSKPRGAGARCSTPIDCDGNLGLYCNALTHQCAKTEVSLANQPCGIVHDTLVACAGGAVCIAGKCVPAAPDLGSCNLQAGPFCLSPAQCLGGKCRVPDPASCR
jgi:hypothetical protein